MSDMLSLLYSHRRAILARDARTEQRLAALYRAGVERPIGAAVEQMTAAMGAWQRKQAQQAHSGTDDTQGSAPLSLTSWLAGAGAEHVHRVQALVSGHADDYADAAQRLVDQDAGQAEQSGERDGLALLNVTKPARVHHTFGRPNPHALSALAHHRQLRRHLFAHWGHRAGGAIWRLLYADVALGRNPRLIAYDLVRLLGSLTYSRAVTIARTSALRAYNDASLATYRANSDVVQGWVWVADLSVNTCGACLALNGTVHSLDEELDDHPNGRCAKAPMTRGWDDILGDLGLGIDTSGIPDTRASFQPGSDWFDALSAAEQRDVLGPGKYAAWADGEFSLDDLIGIVDDPLWGRSIYELPLRRLRRKGRRGA